MQSDSLQCADEREPGTALEHQAGIQENKLSLLPAALEPTSPEIIALLTQAQDKMMQLEQVPIVTEHVLHGGMYSRTITMPPHCPLVGALIKIPTLVITVGDGAVYVNGTWKLVRGYQVIPGCKGRKQAFYSTGPLIITMVFPTQAKTVEEAEAEFTEESALLLSRRQDLNVVTITESDERD